MTIGRKLSLEERMAEWWRSVPGFLEGLCWTKLTDGRTMPTHGHNGPPRGMSAGEAYAVGCKCGAGVLVHMSPCRMSPPKE